jgi:FkbM family methyltransferase
MGLLLYDAKERATRLLNNVCGFSPFLKSVYGCYLRFMNDATYRFCLFASYGEKIVNEIDDLKKGDLFLDIGANIGLFSILASKQASGSVKVVAFEPNKELFPILNMNLQKNNCHNVYAINAAISSEDGEISFKKSPGHSGASHIVLDDESGEESSILSISRNALVFLQNLSFKRALIKIDTEGSELIILKEL